MTLFQEGDEVYVRPSTFNGENPGDDDGFRNVGTVVGMVANVEDGDSHTFYAVKDSEDSTLHPVWEEDMVLSHDRCTTCGYGLLKHQADAKLPIRVVLEDPAVYSCGDFQRERG